MNRAGGKCAANRPELAMFGAGMRELGFEREEAADLVAPGLVATDALPRLVEEHLR
jgi:hypothetical protein